MASENQLLPFDPNKASDLIRQGKLKVVTTPITPAVSPHPTHEAPGGQKMIERARDLLGRDFLGVEAVKNMETKLKGVGVNVEFSLNNLPDFPYNEQDLQVAKRNGEMVVLRAGVNRSGRKNDTPLTLIGFRELFRKDPSSNLEAVFYSFHKDATDWYKTQDFATHPGEIQLGWAIVKKDVLPDSTNKNWNQQEEVLKNYGAKIKSDKAGNPVVRRRTATETAWDTLLYYTNTGERLLEKVYDWTKSRASDGSLVDVGVFGSYGLLVVRWDPEGAYSSVGVCPSR